jgi:hypothetical protein
MNITKVIKLKSWGLGKGGKIILKQTLKWGVMVLSGFSWFGAGSSELRLLPIRQ